MAVPHYFPSLVDGPAQAVIIAGTGLSIPNAPNVDQLKDRLDKIARDLGVIGNSDFYELAEAILTNLIETGRSDAESRLWLAEQLGMLDDWRWFGKIGLPLSGNTPRHRAIARFAVEDRLRAIISLNWDTLLEAALESAGLAEGETEPRPWRVTAHARVIEDRHMQLLVNANVFPVIKPHGCVRDLKEARCDTLSSGTTRPVTFKLTKSEMACLDPKHATVDDRVRIYLAECPIIAVGWKASEKYLRETISTIAQGRTECDCFTLISRSWYPSDDKLETYHDEIASAYGRDKLTAFIAVNNDGQPTLDDVFQWLQARYALSRLIAVSSAQQEAALQQVLQGLDQPSGGYTNPISRWVDCWLPSWVRLCWRAGVMRGANPYTARMVEPWEIPMVPRDIHVPLGTMTGERRDLQAAANLLVTLGDNLGRFEFDMFLGGLWHADEQCLYLPLPSWQEEETPNVLAALNPLFESQPSLGFVRKIRLVALDVDNVAPDDKLCRQLEAHIMSLMPSANFAVADSLSWMRLDELGGLSNATMA